MAPATGRRVGGWYAQRVASCPLACRRANRWQPWMPTCGRNKSNSKDGCGLCRHCHKSIGERAPKPQGVSANPSGSQPIPSVCVFDWPLWNQIVSNGTKVAQFIRIAKFGQIKMTITAYHSKLIQWLMLDFKRVLTRLIFKVARLTPWISSKNLDYEAMAFNCKRILHTKGYSCSL